MTRLESRGALFVNAVCLVLLVRQKSLLFSGRFEQVLRFLESLSDLQTQVYLSKSVLEAINPEIQVRLKSLLEAGKLELLAGALFETWLPLIPKVDAVAQLRLYSSMLEKLFGVFSRGVWLHDCAWESQLIPLLIGAGYEYTFLSARQLERNPGLWITEDQGKTLRLFGFGHGFEKTDQSELLSESLENPVSQNLLQTVVFELEDSNASLQAIETLLAGLNNTRLCSQVMDTQKPQALIYPKPSWNRPEAWRELLANPQINWLHKRIARASQKLNAQFRVPEEAFQLLYHAQQASILEQPRLHSEAYQQIIKSENILEPHKYSWLEVELLDFDCDGSDEVVAEAHTLNLYFKPSFGGNLLEFDDRNRSANLVIKALLDHFIGAEESIFRFETGQTLELGDFLQNQFEGSKYRDRVTMTCMGSVRGPSGVPVSVEIKKAIRIFPKESKLEVEYRLTNHGDWDIVTRFGSAWELELHDKNFSLMVGAEQLKSTASTLEHRMTQRLGVRQANLGLELQFNFGRENLVWSFAKPDSILILPLWDLDLPKGRSRRIRYEVKLQGL
jgi:4-alpha-glucanotransferase